jgi:hypothetical protein
MAVMVHAEFRAAGRGSGHASWFSVDSGVVPWLAQVPALPVGAAYGPLELRHALMKFLTVYAHEANPMAQGHTTFTPAEARGAELFRDRCEGCHQARLVTDDAATRVAFERWPMLVLGGDGPITWASDAYAKTGVLPYVHAEGARVPSLRRIYRKWPYFTNGTAEDLAGVLRTARWDGEVFSHAGGSGGTGFEAREVRDLEAFLRLL